MAGIVCGTIAVAVRTAVVICCVCYRKNRKRRRTVRNDRVGVDVEARFHQTASLPISNQGLIHIFLSYKFSFLLNIYLKILLYFSIEKMSELANSNYGFCKIAIVSLG